MKSGVSYLTLGIGLLTGPLFAYGQTPSPTFVAQAPVTLPSSGVLVTQPPAPVPVLPSGVLGPRGRSSAMPSPPCPSRRPKRCELLKGRRPSRCAAMLCIGGPLLGARLLGARRLRGPRP